MLARLSKSRRGLYDFGVVIAVAGANMRVLLSLNSRLAKLFAPSADQRQGSKPSLRLLQASERRAFKSEWTKECRRGAQAISGSLGFGSLGGCHSAKVGER